MIVNNKVLVLIFFWIRCAPQSVDDFSSRWWYFITSVSHFCFLPRTKVTLVFFTLAGSFTGLVAPKQAYNIKKHGSAQTVLPLGLAFAAKQPRPPWAEETQAPLDQLVLLQTCAWKKAKVIYDGWCWRQWHSNGLQVWTCAGGGWRGGVCRWERVTQMVSATRATWSGFGVILFLHKGREKEPQPWCGSRFRLADHECSIPSKCGHSSRSAPCFPPFLAPSDTRTRFLFFLLSFFCVFPVCYFPVFILTLGYTYRV